MKAATGELNLTVITLIAIAAVIGFFWVMWDPIKSSLNNQWQNISTSNEASAKKTNLPGVIVLERN